MAQQKIESRQLASQVVSLLNNIIYNLLELRNWVMIQGLYKERSKENDPFPRAGTVQMLAKKV